MDGYIDDGFFIFMFYDEFFFEVLDRFINEWNLVEVNCNMLILNVVVQLVKNLGGWLYNFWYRVKMGENEINLVMFDLFEDLNQQIVKFEMFCFLLLDGMVMGQQ